MADNSTFDPTTGADKTFLEQIVRALVDKPDEVDVTRKVDELGVLLILKVAADDMKKIIGKHGQTVKSIRQLVRVIGAKLGLRVNLKVLEPDGSEYRVRDDDQQPGQPGVIDAAAAF